MNMDYRNFTATGLTTLLFLAVPGCGTGGHNKLALAPVEGIVQLDGEPLANAKVEFNPVATPDRQKKNAQAIGASVAITNDEGRYHLKFDSYRKGAVPGEHTVKITTADIDPDSSQPQIEKVPRRYNVSTQLKERVNEGTNEINFELTSKATAGRRF